MADLPTLAEFNLLLRGGIVALLALIAAVLLRDQPKAQAARLGAFFAVGAGAYAICSTPGFHGRAGLAAAPFLALAVGNNVVFWMFARSLFGEGFRLRPAYGAVWVALAALGIAAGLGWLAPRWERPAGIALSLQALGFAALAIGQTLQSWSADLVEARRRLRVFIVGASAAHMALTATAGLAPRLDVSPMVRLADAAALGLIAAVVAWSLLRVQAGGLFAQPVARPVAVAALEPNDAALLNRLDHEMRHQRAYRDETLSIGKLAHRLGAPEYRLRRAINQGLGQRNFAAYLNGHRIAEAKAALADASQAEVPVLTIALDAGFGSLGPFNRAFKAETGVTPTAFRRAALGLEGATAQATAA